MKFNPKTFDVKSVIQHQVNKEAEVEHAHDKGTPLPKYTPAKIMRNKVGWFMVLKCLLP